MKKPYVAVTPSCEYGDYDLINMNEMRVVTCEDGGWQFDFTFPDGMPDGSTVTIFVDDGEKYSVEE